MPVEGRGRANAGRSERHARLAPWLVAIGLALAAGGWMAHRDRAGLSTHGLRLPAQVVQVEQRTVATADTTETLYAPRIRFRHPDGREVVFVADAWTHAPRHQPGEAVHVRVDDARGLTILDSAADLYGPLALFVGAGLLLAGLGTVLLLRRA